MTEQTSHGRGGVGNFGPDDRKYVDGEIVRAGPTGDQGDGPFSTGRGGEGNIGGKGAAKAAVAADHDVVPKQAERMAKLESHHVGRGGAGNESHVHEKQDHHHHHHHHHGGEEGKSDEGLADKLKHKILGEGHKHEGVNE